MGLNPIGFFILAFLVRVMNFTCLVHVGAYFSQDHILAVASRTLQTS